MNSEKIRYYLAVVFLVLGSSLLYLLLSWASCFIFLAGAQFGIGDSYK